MERFSPRGEGVTGFTWKSSTRGRFSPGPDSSMKISESGTRNSVQPTALGQFEHSSDCSTRPIRDVLGNVNLVDHVSQGICDFFQCYCFHVLADSVFFHWEEGLVRVLFSHAVENPGLGCDEELVASGLLGVPDHAFC